jgi:hypothetical protein
VNNAISYVECSPPLALEEVQALVPRLVTQNWGDRVSVNQILGNWQEGEQQLQQWYVFVSNSSIAEHAEAHNKRKRVCDPYGFRFDYEPGKFLFLRPGNPWEQWAMAKMRGAVLEAVSGTLTVPNPRTMYDDKPLTASFKEFLLQDLDQPPTYTQSAWLEHMLWCAPEPFR